MNVLFPPTGLTLAHVAGYTVLSFILTVIVTRPLIGWLKARQFGKAIRVDGPDHAAKAGTPTMGGLGMLAVIGGLGLVLAYQSSIYPELPSSASPILLILLGMLAFGALGLIDDRAGLARKSGRHELGVGLTARKMLLLQFVAAGLLVSLASRLGWPYSLVMQEMSVSAFATAFLAMVAIVGMVNGVNLSDGLDGLAAGLLAIAFVWIGLITFAFAVWASSIHPLSVGTTSYEFHLQSFYPLIALVAVCAAACLGFLVFNRHPAQVFMGNVASMGLGAGLAVWCLVTLDAITLLLLPIVGAVFVAEVVSDLIQIGYFKWTGGKRFFRMAPLHHHFELGGMPETKVVQLFWIAGLGAGMVACAIMTIL